MRKKWKIFVHHNFSTNGNIIAKSSKEEKVITKEMGSAFFEVDEMDTELMTIRLDVPLQVPIKILSTGDYTVSFSGVIGQWNLIIAPSKKDRQGKGEDVNVTIGDDEDR